MPSAITASDSNDSEVLVTVENVSKKFCRSLKKSLWYGVTDVASAINPFSGNNEPAHQAQGTKHEAPALRADEFWAVQNVSFELKRGECLGLIGHNGAGKSTLLKVLNGLIPPDTGRITMKGRVCALIELNAGFNPILTGRENIYNQAALLGFSKSEIDGKFDRIVAFADIGDFLDMPLQFLLWNTEMLPVMDIVAADLEGFPVGGTGGNRVEVTAVVPRMELNAGKYNLSVIVLSGDLVRVLCRHDNAGFVQIQAASASGAYVLAVAEWSSAPVKSQPIAQLS